jgi:hypothetical protein
MGAATGPHPGATAEKAVPFPSAGLSIQIAALRFCSRIAAAARNPLMRPLSATELIAPVGFAETVLHSPAWLATVPSSETPRPVIPASTTAVATIVRTGRAVARAIAWRRRTVAATIARRRRAVARVGAEIKIDALG